MRTQTWIIAMVISLITGFAYSSDEWPAFRGPNYDGSATDLNFSPEKGDLTVSWRAKAGSGYSGISIVGGKAVTAFTDGDKDVLVAYDAKSGNELWRQTLSPKYAGHDGSHDGPIATPAIHNNKVFALSAYGDLVAFDLPSGKQIWALNITKEGGRAPHYGYTASPLPTNGVVIVQLGGDKGKSVAAFDQNTGKLKWSVGDDMVNYQSPILMKIGGKERVIATSDKKMLVVDPADGKVLLDYDHGGGDGVSELIVPVPLDNGRLLLRNKQDSADLVRLNASPDGKINIEKVWSEGVFKNSYNPPVYYKGHLYGFNGRILTCVNADTGKTVWRSRGVPDGFLLLVNGNLIVQTKVGAIHVGPASPEGWKETKQLQLFREISWTPPVFADGAIFTRSHGEVARIDVSAAARPTIAQVTPTPLPAVSKFGQFLKQIESASDKKQKVDELFTQYKQSPILEEPDRLIFLYRGEGHDMAITGDIESYDREIPMIRVQGTDLFYHVARLEQPDARINYRYIRNFEENLADPHNPRVTPDRAGNPTISWVAMPDYKEAEHLKESPADKRGTFESHEIKSKTNPHGLAKVDVYLPAGYTNSKESYPVLYVMDGKRARSQGYLDRTLENLGGTVLRPVILVYLTELATNDGKQRIPIQEQSLQTSKYFAQEIVPFIDSRYRTLKDRENRAIIGNLSGAGDAMLMAFENSDIFGGVALQSMWPMDVESAVKPLITGPDRKPMRIYMDWGMYDARSKSGGWDLRVANREFYTFFKEKGYSPAGGETHEGYGWGNWRNRNDKLLSILFPKS